MSTRITSGRDVPAGRSRSAIAWSRHSSSTSLPNARGDGNGHRAGAGFLIPSGTPPERSADADEDDDFEEVDENPGAAEDPPPYWRDHV